jgi:hypothetical protein
MAELSVAAATLSAALYLLQMLVGPWGQPHDRHARDLAEIASLTHEREGLLARIAELEEEVRSLASLTEEVEGRLDGAIADIRTALGR